MKKLNVYRVDYCKDITGNIKQKTEYIEAENISAIAEMLRNTAKGLYIDIRKVA